MYGPSITADQAKLAAAPAIAEARKNQFTMAVAIVDTAGELVYFEKMDDTQIGSIDIAIDKARSAVWFKRTTKVLQEVLAAGGDGLRVLGMQGAVPIEGGIPLTVDGKKVFARIMQAGERDSRDVAAEAVIEVGDAGAFAYSVNGREGKPLGAEGQVRSLKLTPATAAQYLR